MTPTNQTKTPYTDKTFSSSIRHRESKTFTRKCQNRTTSNVNKQQKSLSISKIFNQGNPMGVMYHPLHIRSDSELYYFFLLISIWYVLYYNIFFHLLNQDTLHWQRYWGGSWGLSPPLCKLGGMAPPLSKKAIIYVGET